MNTCLIFLLFATNPILAFIPGTSHSNIKYEGSNTHGATLITNPIDISDSVISTGIRRDEFPILRVNAYEGKKLIYLDSAASSQKPEAVIRTMNHYYENTNANVHRGAHSLGNQATELYEEARNKVASFVNANRREEIVFTRGATEAINLVAQSWTQRLKPGDEIIISVMEHHSNLVPWQMAALRTGAKLKFVRLTPDQSFDLDHFKSLLTSNTKLVAVSHASNVLGSVNPVEEIIKLTHAVGGLVLLDACQSVPHMPVDVQALNVDFLVASGHKMCGPTGIGFLYGCYNHLLSMPPINGGGEMIDEVKLEYSTYALPPSRFEAGTPAIAEVIGLGAACDYLKSIGMDVIHNHEIKLGAYLYQKLNDVQGTTLFGPLLSSGRRTGVVAFNMKTIHASDLAFFLDQEGVAIRTGHHCAQPLHGLLGVKGSARASLYFYNNKEDVDLFIEKMVGVINMFETMNNVL